MASIEEVQAAVLEPMRSLFRVPFGIEDPEAALAQYAKTLTRFSGDSLRAGWERVVELHKKRDWPPIADLLDAVRAAEASIAVRAGFGRADASGDPSFMHEARIHPTPEMRLFLFRKADVLRKNPTWESFLDSIHPTAEHCFFSQATMGAVANNITGLTVFEAQYVRQTWGDRLKEAFGAPVRVGA